MSDEFVIIVNRTTQPYEGMYDGKARCFQPMERRPMQPHVARNLVAQSYSSMGLTTGVPTGYRLGIEGETDCSPLAVKERAELLDRTMGETLQHSRPQVLTQHGLAPIVADIGVSPVATPVTQAKLIQAGKKTMRSHKKKPVAKTLGFHNPTPRPEAGVGPGSVTSVNT
jgi:hypothetical protein